MADVPPGWEKKVSRSTGMLNYDAFFEYAKDKDLYLENACVLSPHRYGDVILHTNLTVVIPRFLALMSK